MTNKAFSEDRWSLCLNCQKNFSTISVIMWSEDTWRSVIQFHGIFRSSVSIISSIQKLRSQLKVFQIARYKWRYFKSFSATYKSIWFLRKGLHSIIWIIEDYLKQCLFVLVVSALQIALDCDNEVRYSGKLYLWWVFCWVFFPRIYPDLNFLWGFIYERCFIG